MGLKNLITLVLAGIIFNGCNNNNSTSSYSPIIKGRVTFKKDLYLEEVLIVDEGFRINKGLFANKVVPYRDYERVEVSKSSENENTRKVYLLCVKGFTSEKFVQRFYEITSEAYKETKQGDIFVEEDFNGLIQRFDNERRPATQEEIRSLRIINNYR